MLLFWYRTVPNRIAQWKRAIRLLLIDYSYAFNTIVPIKLAFKLTDLGLNSSLCNWIQDFLTGRPQAVKPPTGLCPESPALLFLHTRLCVLSQLHFYSYNSIHFYYISNLLMILWFWASLTTMMRLHTWMRWRDSHHGARTTVSLNVSKTKELIVDFRKRQQRPYTPLMISGTPVERVSSFKYLGVNISEDLTWTPHIQTQVKKARQRLYHLRQLMKFRVSPAILKTFYSGAIGSVLTQCISVWYRNATNQDCKALQRVVRLAERISGSALSSLQDIYLKRCKSRAAKIIKDSNHPGL